MKYFFSLLLLMTLGTTLSAQVIDGSFEFQSDPDKKYSLYVPSSYDPATPQPLMLGLHPLNTNRWDAIAWRDTLINFAEANDLLLVCPDGGLDGAVDDAIDTAFTTVLIDSVSTWYNVDQDEKYMMGFSWGGKTSYTYGLRRTGEFKGYLIIGAAVQINEVNGIIENAKNENFYLLHGSNDSPNVRFQPLLNALQENDACVESMLMSGVGHTIDFPNRNELMTTAFQWLRTNVCMNTADEELNPLALNAYPNPFENHVHLDFQVEKSQLQLIDKLGRNISFLLEGQRLTPLTNENTILFLKIQTEGQVTTLPIMKL